jgi:hypothetical protein
MIFDPLVVTGGNPTTGIVTLAGPAPPGGTLVPLLSSHPQYASVPASVTIPAGAKSATFPIATSPVPFSFDVTIEAVSTQNASRRLALRTPGPRLTSFTLSAKTVTGGDNLSGTVRFDAPIPPSPFPATGDALVTLKSTHPALGMSYLVAVPVGQTSATFSVGVRNVPTTTTLEIIATYDDVALRVPITVNGSSAALSSLTLNVNSVSGGQGGVGHVTLTAPAPAGHVLINLSASHPALNVPADVTVSSGTTTGLFAWTANNVAQTTPATITASYGASNVSANVTVNPATTKHLWVTSLAVAPTSVPGGSSSTATVTLNNNAPSGGATVQLSSMSPATVPGSVTVPAGASSATFNVSTTAVSSTTQAKVWALLNTTWGAVLTVEGGGSPPPSGGTPAAPTLLAPGSGTSVSLPLTFDWNDVANATTYQIHVDDSSSFTTPRTIDSTVTASQLTTASGLTNRTYWWRVRGRNSAGTAGAWSSTRSFTVQGAASTPTLSTLSISPTSVTGGSANAAGTARLTAAAPSGGAVVTLSSNNTNAATVPSSVTIPAGSTSATFTITSRAVTTATSVTVSGVYGGVTRTGTLTVNVPGAPATATLSSLSISPTSVTGGSANAQGTATLSAAAPSGGTVVTLSSNNSNAATVPASITIAAGATSGTFTVTSRTVTTSASVIISGASGGVTRTGTLTVNPAAGGGGTGTATLTVSATGRSGERVTSNPAGINVSVGSSGSAPFNTGTSITLTVSNGRDAIWSGACSSGGNKTKTCTLTLNANASVTANVQ